MQEIKKTIKITLAAARTNAKLTQQEVADYMGVSVQTIGNWEKEPQKMNVGSAFKLAQLYDMEVSSIIFVPCEYGETV